MRTALWEVTSWAGLGVLREPSYADFSNSFHLDSGAILMTTGHTAKGGTLHQVITTKGVGWVAKMDLVWRSPGKDTRRVKRVT